MNQKQRDEFEVITSLPSDAPGMQWKPPSAAFGRRELLELHEELCSKARALMQKKNADYSTVGPFQNLKASEAFGISAELGTLVRLGDKLSRIRTLFEREAAVTDESFDDTIIDIINYAVLLAGLRKEKANGR